MKLEYRDRPFEVKAADGTEGGAAICTFEGTGACCTNLDDNGDIIDKGAFAADLAWTKSEGKVRDEHQTTTGRIVEAKDEGDLWVKGEIYATAAGKDQAVLLKTGTVTRLSIGYMVLSRQWLDSPEEVMTYWQEKGYTPSEEDLLALGYYKGARLLKRLKVAEVSTTWWPANPLTRIDSVKTGQPGGRTLDGHAAAALATVGEYVERAEAVAKLRGQEGRALSPEAKRKAAALRDRLAVIAAAPTAVARDAKARSLHAAFLATCARAGGATGA